MIDESKINVGKCYDAEPIQHKAIWNEAIEAAAKLAESKNTNTASSDQIRKLKKRLTSQITKNILHG